MTTGATLQRNHAQGLILSNDSHKQSSAMWIQTSREDNYDDDEADDSMMLNHANITMTKESYEQ